MPQLTKRFRGGVNSQNDLSGITWDHHEDDKDDNRDEEKRQEKDEGSLEHISYHLNQ
jgi:hypothetical protein